jgi:hypothetical protein
MHDGLAVHLAQFLEGGAPEAPLLNQVKGQPLKSSGDYAPAAGPIHVGYESRFPAADRHAVICPFDRSPVKDHSRDPVKYPDEQVCRPTAGSAVNHAVTGHIQRGNVALIRRNGNARAREARQERRHRAFLRESPVHDLIGQRLRLGRLHIVLRLTKSLWRPTVSAKFMNCAFR